MKDYITYTSKYCQHFKKNNLIRSKYSVNVYCVLGRPWQDSQFLIERTRKQMLSPSRLPGTAAMSVNPVSLAAG